MGHALVYKTFTVEIKPQSSPPFFRPALIDQVVFCNRNGSFGWSYTLPEAFNYESDVTVLTAKTKVTFDQNLIEFDRKTNTFK